MSDELERNSGGESRAMARAINLYISKTGTDPVTGRTHGTTPDTAFRTMKSALAYAKVNCAGKTDTVVLNIISEPIP